VVGITRVYGNVLSDLTAYRDMLEYGVTKRPMGTALAST